jgi:hypothetical protein
MFRSFTVKNFRCFHDFALDSLTRVNLIAGKNNTGKTALLEGIFLHLGPNVPNLSIGLNAFRGLSQLDFGAEELWGWLFFGKRIDETIELHSTSTDALQRSLRIRLARSKEGEVSATGNGTTTTPGPRMSGLPASIATGPMQRELVLDYEDSSGQRGCSRAVPFGPTIRIETASLTPPPPAIFLITHGRFHNEDAARFSKLEEIGHHEEIISVLRVLEPRLKRLAVLVSSGVPLIHADIGIGRLVPMPFVGEGMVRLLSMVLAIANAQDGFVLVDEIENGLHYSVMQKVWHAIGRAARQANVQVFATTHSWECIQAAHRAYKENGPYELRYHRLDRLDDRIVVNTFKEENLERVQYTDLEIR